MTRLGQPANAEHQPEQGAGNHADHRALERHQRALDEERQIFADDVPLEPTHGDHLFYWSNRMKRAGNAGSGEKRVVRNRAYCCLLLG